METFQLRDLLVACLKKSESSPDLSGLTPRDWEIFLQTASLQRVAPLLWHRLRQKGLSDLIPLPAAETLRDAYRRNTLHNLRFNGQLQLLLTALASENIPLILLKGIVLANTVYPNIALREMNDIDALAHPEHLERIADILTSLGYRPATPFSLDLVLQTQHHLPRFIKKNQAGFEIHWTLGIGGNLQAVDTAELWDRAQPVRIAGCPALMFSGEDMLLHLCIHVSYQHRFAFGLRPFCDIAALIDSVPPDWQAFAARTAAGGWQRGVYLSLRLAGELAGAAVPADILERLRPEDLPDALLEAVRSQVFADKLLSAKLPTPAVQLLASRHPAEKIKIFFGRVFLSRFYMANLYSVPINSPKIYFLYLHRLWDLLRRYGSILGKYQNRDDAVTSFTDSTKQITDWLG